MHACMHGCVDACKHRECCTLSPSASSENIGLGLPLCVKWSGGYSQNDGELPADPVSMSSRLNGDSSLQILSRGTSGSSRMSTLR